MGREHLTGLTSFIFMLDRYLKICRALMHNFTPLVIITAVTRDGSFELGRNLKRTALATRRVIPGSRVPLGKRIKEAPDNILIAPDKDYGAFYLLLWDELMWHNQLCYAYSLRAG